MPFLVKLAARNLWRNRRRTVITFSALSLGIAMLIAFNSLSSGFSDFGFRNLRDFEIGEIQIHAPGYFAEKDDLPLEPALDAEHALAAARAAGGPIRAVAPRVITSARLHVGWEEFPITLIGIDPQYDPTVFDVTEYVHGRMPRSGHPEAVIGAGLAELLDIDVGDMALLITRTRTDALQAMDLEVVGLIRTPSPAVNQRHVYVPIDIADAELALGGRVTELTVRADDPYQLDGAVQALRRSFADHGIDAEVFRWDEVAADLVAMMQADTVSNLVITGVILMIALVGVTNTILLGVLERRQEIGIMKAMGMREGHIIRLFLLEATGIALLAIVAGFALGALANVYLVRHGLDIGAMFGEVDWGIPISGVIYGVWNPAVFGWGAVAGIVTCWIAAYFPARHAAHLNAATAVRG